MKQSSLNYEPKYFLNQKKQITIVEDEIDFEMKCR